VLNDDLTAAGVTLKTCASSRNSPERGLPAWRVLRVTDVVVAASGNFIPPYPRRN
jgi:hypothetical protein